MSDAGIAYLKVEVYYQVDGSSDPIGIFCNQKFSIGVNDVKVGGTKIPRNNWFTAYIPVEYLTDEVLRGQHSLIQTKFGTAGDWRFDNVQEVRLKGLEFITEADERTQFLDMSDSSVVDLFQKPSGTFGHVAENEGEQAYLSWQGTGDWQSLYLEPNTRTFNAETVYDYIAVELYYVSTDAGDIDVSGYFFKGVHTIGAGNNGADTGLQANTWITVYLPVDTFYSSNVAAGTGYLLQCTFNKSGNGHFPGISEVRIGSIFFTNTAGSADTDYVFTLNA